MSKVEAETHRCSCGRTFRHGISLKRHQKVSGCAELEVSVEVGAPMKTVSTPKPVVKNTQEEIFQSATVVVTAQQIAAWQKEKMLQTSPQEEAQTAPSIDWNALKETTLDFAEFAVDQLHAFSRAAGSLLGLGARFTLFGGFLVALGWTLLFGISTGLSAAPSNGLDQQESARLSAESTVSSFLQTSRLGQFERARGYLSTQTRGTVTAGDLRQMFSKLPLGETPSSISAELEQSDQVAKVTVCRAGQAEVYTLVRETQGWGLASVAVRRS